MSKIQTGSDQKQRRARVLRMAWTLAAIATTLYVGFILRAVLGK
jgi:hypothetical protein